MGYQPTVYNLVFDDLDGLEVKAYGTSIGQVRKFTNFSDEASVEAAFELLDAFSKALISWNLEDPDGNPVPATARGSGGVSRLQADLSDCEYLDGGRIGCG